MKCCFKRGIERSRMDWKEREQETRIKGLEGKEDRRTKRRGGRVEGRMKEGAE
jgi:hypothetical protein